MLCEKRYLFGEFIRVLQMLWNYHEGDCNDEERMMSNMEESQAKKGMLDEYGIGAVPFLFVRGYTKSRSETNE